MDTYGEMSPIMLMVNSFSGLQVLVAREFSYLEGDDELGICAKCLDGTDSFHCFAIPTQRELYKLPAFGQAMSFQDKRALVIDHIGLDEDRPPWARLDRSGNIVPGTDTDDALEDWLNEAVRDERLTGWDGGFHSEYGLVFPILEALSDTELTALGIRKVDLGGPASSVPALTMTASTEQFNAIMRKHELPYVLLDDDEDGAGL